MNRMADTPDRLLKQTRALTAIFILGLVLSGATALPLVSEVDLLAQMFPSAIWITDVQTALHSVAASYPFLFYGTDWLAFGHFAIAIAFVGALHDPVRNQWLFTFGLLACGFLVPYALIFGALRGIPLWWRIIDCSFGIIGAIPLWLCRNWSRQLEDLAAAQSAIDRQKAIHSLI